MSWDEERAGRALRAGLAEIESPAGRVELDRIVVDGRRGERRARLVRALGGAALAVVVGVPLAVLAARGVATTEVGPAGKPVAGPAGCTVTALNRSGPDGAIRTTDPTGAVVLGINANHLVRWRDGVSEIVATDASGGILMPTAVNPAGVAVGFYPTGESPAHRFGWVFRDGVLTPLARPAGARTATPLGINGAGDIVGAMMPDSLASRSTLVVWPAAAPGSPRLIQPGVQAVPVGITADGSVLGTVLGAGDRGDTVAVWGPDGTRRDLPTPDGWTSAGPTAIHGDVVYGTVSRTDMTGGPMTDDLPEPGATGPDPAKGGSAWSGKRMSPVRWNLGDGTGTVVPVEGAVVAASDSGWLLLDVRKPGSFDGSIASVSPAGTAYPLPAAPGTQGSTWGKWISSDGRTVIADAVVGAGVQKPFTWTCAVR